jgi:hypothetical protein
VGAVSKCPTCGQEEKLSDPQRDRYFAMIGQLVQHPKLSHLTREQLHLYFKDKFLGGRDVMLPNGKVIYVLNSVSRKSGPDKLTMSEFMDKIEALMAEWGVWEVGE